VGAFEVLFRSFFKVGRGGQRLVLALSRRGGPWKGRVDGGGRR